MGEKMPFQIDLIISLVTSFVAFIIMMVAAYIVFAFCYWVRIWIKF